MAIKLLKDNPGRKATPLQPGLFDEAIPLITIRLKLQDEGIIKTKPKSTNGYIGLGNWSSKLRKAIEKSPPVGDRIAGLGEYAALIADAERLCEHYKNELYVSLNALEEIGVVKDLAGKVFNIAGTLNETNAVTMRKLGGLVMKEVSETHIESYELRGTALRLAGEVAMLSSIVSNAYLLRCKLDRRDFAGAADAYKKLVPTPKRDGRMKKNLTKANIFLMKDPIGGHMNGFMKESLQACAQ